MTPAVIAHRGCADMHPENTVAAVEAVAPHVDAVEVDVRRCGSGELVVCHDETVDRVTDGSGPVAEHTATELAALDVLGSGAGVPTVAEVVDAVPDQVAINLELKEQGIASEIGEVATAIDNHVVVSAFDADALRPLVGSDAPCELAYLFATDPDSALATAERLDCDYVHPRADLCTDTDLVDRATSRGLGVNVWTLPDCARLAEFAARGVDGVIVDRWDGD